MQHPQKHIVHSTVFFIGWLFSPLTWWNDCFINIPISYIGAHFFAPLFHLPFGTMVIVLYWGTNILGIVGMVVGGKGITENCPNNIKTLMVMALVMGIYSAMIWLLDCYQVLLPVTEYGK